MIGGKFSYVVSLESALFSFFSKTVCIAEDTSFIDVVFILLRLFRFASVVWTFSQRSSGGRIGNGLFELGSNRFSSPLYAI